MKARGIIAWAMVLGATHLVAFFLSRQLATPAEAPAASGADVQASDDAARRGKSGLRDRTGPAYAQLWQKLLETPMERADFERARDLLLQDWMKRDLGAVLDLMYGPEGSESGFNNVALHEALTAEIAKNPQLVLEWIRGGRFGSCRNEVFGRWLGSLGHDGQMDVVMAALPDCTHYEKFAGLRYYSGSPDEKNLAKVREALGTWYREGIRRSQVVEEYAKRKAELAVGDTAALFAEETDPQIRLALGLGWMRARMGQTPAAGRVGELRELPEDARAMAAGKMMKTLASDGIKGVTPALEEMSRLNMWSEMSSEGVRDTIGYAATNELAKGGTETFNAVMKIRDPAARAVLMQGVGQGSVSNAAGKEIYARADEMLEPGPEHDSYVAGLVRSLLNSSKKDLARQGIERIESAELRAQMTKELEASESRKADSLRGP